MQRKQSSEVEKIMPALMDALSDARTIKQLSQREYADREELDQIWKLADRIQQRIAQSA